MADQVNRSQLASQFLKLKNNLARLLARERGFLSTNRRAQLSIYFIIAMLLGIFALGFAIVSLLSERDLTYNIRDDLPERDLAQWQRHTLLLLNGLNSPDASENADQIKLNFDLAQSRITIIENETLEELLPEDLFGVIQAAIMMWDSFDEQLADWLANPQDERARAVAAESARLIELELNEAQTDIVVHGLSLNTRGRLANTRLLYATGGISVFVVLIVIAATDLFTRMSRGQLQSIIEKESMRKFPEQDPNPIMRFDPDYTLLYGNPASQPLETILGVKDGKITKEKYRAWLHEGFKSGNAPRMEDSAGGRVYSILNSPVKGENVVNIYGFDITDLKRAESTVRQQLSRLNAMHTIDKTISTATNLQNTFKVLLEQICQQLGVDAAAIFITENSEDRLYAAAFQGYRSHEVSRFSLRLGESLLGKVAEQRKLIAIPDLSKSALEFAPELTEVEGFKSYFACPLEVRGELLGVLETAKRKTFTPDPEWLEFLTTLAGQAAIALDNAELYDGLLISNEELRLAYDTTLEGWAKALELRDKETEGHSRRVTELTMLLAARMGIPEEQWDAVRRGAILHDIGKMGVPDEILLKPGKLDDTEWAIMKRHADYAYELLSPISFLKSALDIPYAHHEKWDGSGYPRGLRGEEIPLPARVFAIVDVWDALRSDRPYRPAWSREKTLAYIKENADTHFDPRVVEHFCAAVEENQIQ
jgi:putative nucleotidyltransferase with HDIG domain